MATPVTSHEVGRPGTRRDRMLYLPTRSGLRGRVTARLAVVATKHDAQPPPGSWNGPVTKLSRD